MLLHRFSSEPRTTYSVGHEILANNNINTKLHLSHFRSQIAKLLQSSQRICALFFRSHAVSQLSNFLTYQAEFSNIKL